MTHLESSWGSTEAPKASDSRERGAWLVLLLGLALSRFAVMPEVIFEWDSANYVLGTRDFNVFEHQPHPPGNPLFVLMLWLVGPMGAGPLQFLIVNTLLGGGAILLLGWMARPLVGPRGAFAIGLAFALCPPFWFQGAVTTAYVAECFTVTVAGAVALGLARGTLSLPLGAFFAAMALGLRPSAVPAIAPVLAYGIWLARPSFKPLAISGGVFVATCLVWTVPIFVSAGGVAPYREASAALWDWQVELGSLLGDGRIVQANASKLLRYLFDALNILWFALVFNGVVLLVRRRLPWKSLLFCAIWTVPGALVYALHHLAKSAYVLTLVPACFLLVALLASGAAQHLQGWRKRIVVGANGVFMASYMGLNLLAFQTAIPVSLLTYRDAPVDLSGPMLMTGDYGRLALEYRTWPQRHTQDLLDALNDDRDLALFLFGTHELMRMQMASSPEQWMVASSVDHGVLFDSTGRMSDLSFGAYQNVVLRAPDVGLTLEQPTTVGLKGSGLRLARLGRTLEAPNGRIPRRILVFTQCQPCRVSLGESVRRVRDYRVSAGILAVELEVTGF